MHSPLHFTVSDACPSARITRAENVMSIFRGFELIQRLQQLGFEPVFHLRHRVGSPMYQIKCSFPFASEIVVWSNGLR